MNRRQMMISGLLLGSAGLGASFLLPKLLPALTFSTPARRKFKSHVSIFFPGAPSRWMFDQFLNPYGESGIDFALNPGISNCFKQGSQRYTEMDYQLIKDPKSQLHLPWLWQFDIPNSQGGFSDPKRLLSHLILIQGINTRNAAHIFSKQGHFHNYKSEQSLGALSVDQELRPFTGLSTMDQFDVFVSKNKYKRLYLMEGKTADYNLASSILKPFKDYETNSRCFNQDINLSPDDFCALEKQITVLKEQINDLDLDQLWVSKYQKYIQLIDSDDSLRRLFLLQEQAVVLLDRHERSL
ncbi:MAG: hypothetical protein HRT44_03560, partial [Bdellovibrionales bacterium]|nr:hypothetical protein [Bdellovibrionales bacterium]NQZ18322.1 hypothetical protein [Bdellovibrionales bacterium]